MHRPTCVQDFLHGLHGHREGTWFVLMFPFSLNVVPLAARRRKTARRGQRLSAQGPRIPGGVPGLGGGMQVSLIT